jgi:F0F1-type ATP synthase membrane subunit b/b'
MAAVYESVGISRESELASNRERALQRKKQAQTAFDKAKAELEKASAEEAATWGAIHAAREKGAGIE